MKLSRRMVIAATAGLLMGASAPAVAQQGLGAKPISIMVPFAPGGGTDLLARELGRILTETQKLSVIIDNRGGAGGQIAARTTSKAPPDGATLLFVTSTFITTAATQKTPSYDVEKDFTPIAMLGRGPLLVVSSNQSGLTSVREIIATAKAKPDALNYVSSGVGGILHLATELFKQKAQVNLTHVPYSGSGPAVIDLIAGRAEVFISTVPTILGQVQSKNVRLLAVTSDKRSPLFPDTPTLAEEGVPGLNLETWWGIVGPQNMPADLVAQLNASINEAAAAPAMRKRFEEEGATTFRGSGADFGSALKTEFSNWRRVVESGNLFTN